MRELLERLGYHPRYCVWELTLACNLRCQHCGSHAGEPRPDELTRAECLVVADALIELGCRNLSLSGGEPTLHPCWAELGQRLTAGGVRVNLISNGWRWGDEDLARARAAGLQNVVFSIDGTEEAHDTVRRRGSYRRVVAAVSRSVSAGMPVAVCTHLNRLNARVLPALRETLRGLGVGIWQVQLGNPSGAMAAHPELTLAPIDLLELIPAVAALCDDGAAPVLRVAENLGYYGRYEAALRGPRSRLPFFFGCRAGCQVLGIESDGAVKGCLSLPSCDSTGAGRGARRPFVEGLLREEPLQAIWRRADAFALNRRFSPGQLGGFCAVCRYGDICRGGCSWTSHCRTGGCFDNPCCFYRQAVLNGRLDLLDEAPTKQELRYAARRDWSG